MPSTTLHTLWCARSSEEEDEYRREECGVCVCEEIREPYMVCACCLPVLLLLLYAVLDNDSVRGGGGGVLRRDDDLLSLPYLLSNSLPIARNATNDALGGWDRRVYARARAMTLPSFSFLQRCWRISRASQ